MVAKISIRTAIDYISRKFRFNDDGWVGNGIEWIGAGLTILHMIDGLEPCAIDKELVNHRALLPTCADALLSVDYGGCYLPLDRPSKFAAGCCTTAHTYHRGYIKGPYLEVSAETGTVTFHVLRFPTDDEGLPMIPSSTFVLEALAWFVLREWLGQGNIHPVFNWADANRNWETWWPRAQNDVGFPKLYNQESFRNMWVSLIPQINLHYNGNLIPQAYAGLPYGDIADFMHTQIG